MKLIIGVPTNGSIKSTTVSCIVENMFGVIKEVKEDLEQLNLIIPSTCLVHVNRNSIAEVGLEREASHIMFIDSDMVFPVNAVSTLIFRDKDIIGGNYNVRGRLPLTRTVNYLYPVLPSEPFICESVAAGFLLVKADVFKALEPPWFFFEHLGGGRFLGEDYWFCNKAKEKGYEIWCDPTIQIGHIGDYRY